MRVRKTQRRADEKVQLMMTPMIDIVFLLLVFFILTFKIAEPEGDFNIKMPQAAPVEGPPADTQLQPIKILMTAHPPGHGEGHLAALRMGERLLFTVPPAVIPPETDATAKQVDYFEGYLASRFALLRAQVRQYLRDDRGPGAIAEDAEVELACDYQLHFDYVIRAITAVYGYVDPQTGRIHKLIEKVDFAPPKPR